MSGRKTEIADTFRGQHTIEQSEADSTSKEAIGESLIAIAKAEDLKAINDEAFFHEMVEICIHPSNDPSDTTRYVNASINGIDCYLLRGEWKAVKRYVVDWLCWNKNDSWTFGYRRGADGAITEVSNVTSHLIYPFSVRNDTARGNKWLQERLQR